MVDYFQGSHGDKTVPVGAAVIKKSFVPFWLADPSLSRRPRPESPAITGYYILHLQTAKCSQFRTLTLVPIIIISRMDSTM